MPVRVLLVEDHVMFRQTLEDFIGLLEGFEVCGACESAEEALERMPTSGADVVVVDISLPGMDGLELIRELRRRGMTIPCVVLSGHASGDHAARSRQAGAREFLPKSRTGDLERVLRRVVAERTR